MAPSFLSRLVKVASPTALNRERSERSSDSPRPSHQRSPSTPNPVQRAAESSRPTSPATPSSPPVKININNIPNASSASVNTVDTSSTRPSVTVVPPSPLPRKSSFSPFSSELDLHTPSDRHSGSEMPATSLTVSPRLRTISAPSKPTSANTTPKPETERPSSSRSRPSTPNSSFANLKQKLQKSSSNLNLPLSQPQNMRRKSSAKSLKIPAPIIVPPPTGPSYTESIDTPDIPTMPATAVVTMSPIVESPNNMGSMDGFIMQAIPQSAPVMQRADRANGHRTLQAPTPRDSDTLSISSAASTDQKKGKDKDKDKDKKKSWKPSNSRKPSGLAGAIAASGIAMANPTMSQTHYSASMIQIAQSSSTSNSRKSSNATGPQTPYSGSHVKSRSVDLVPQSARSPSTPSRRRATAASINSDNNSENNPEGPEYFDLDADSSIGDRSDDETDIELDDNIPVTGFAVASNKRNADFHELFPSIPEGDYLIEDYGCALQREILIQGRLYISENHICFHANIFGWVTDLSIPIYDITSLEKKMTAFVIPNGIQISTRNTKYTFASFLSRDTTFDVIYNIWRHARPDDSTSIFSSARVSLECASTDQVGHLNGAAKVAVNRVTQCACGRSGDHLPEVALAAVVPGTPDRIHNLMFASGFIKNFMTVEQKLLDIQVSDWVPLEPGSKLLARNMSYIKPLNGTLGPKQTKCEIRDETLHADDEDYFTMLTTTRTPDVPSGGVFSVKTRTCIMWASAITSKVIVTTQVEWTGRSFIKGIIEKSAIDGQKVYHADLERSMRAYIQEHQSEFVPIGIDPSAIELAESATAVPGDVDNSGPGSAVGTGEHLSEEAERRKREHVRNRLGLQWAWDTFDGAHQVASRSTKGALELIKDAWDQSSTTTILWFVIAILVLSNLWTMVRMGSREEHGRRKEVMRTEERDRWVQGVVTALRDELVVKPVQPQPLVVSLPYGTAATAAAGTLPPLGSPLWHSEIAHLRSALDGIEDKIRYLKENLDEVARNVIHDALD